MIELKEYQDTAINELKDKINELLNFSENKVCVFQSPTGSGKTIMMAEALKKLVTDKIDDRSLSFVWISVRQLHQQSKDKLEKYFEDSRVLKCSDFEDLEDKKIGENEILFFNWESINKKKNIYVRENEMDNNLSNIITNTKEEGREIILIIDESHHTAKSEKSREIIDGINPKVTIEVSATPHLKGHLVEVDFNKVIADGMIKKEVSINPDIDKEKIKKSADELVIKTALKKRQELLKLYKKEGSNINPLVLIQLPDKKSGVMNIEENIKKLLKDKFKISEENGKLAIWLSENKTPNLENIEKNESDVQVLIFKQAISLGWDCPRAQILILFREWKSVIFSIQTVGRIMRMPELKHYDEDELNKGHVYTNLSDIEIAEGIAKDYLIVYEARRDNGVYKKISLNSSYLKRQREKTRLSGEFSKIFLDVARKNGLDRKINFKPSELVNNIMVDGKIIKLDQAQVVKSGKEDIQVKITPKEVQYRFELLIRSLCSPFAPADSSGRIRTAIYKTFEKMFKINNWDMIQKFVLGKENYQLITDLVNKSKEVYTSEVVEKVSEQREEIVNDMWEIPEKIEYNSRYKEMNYNKNIMVPPYFKSGSKPENEFIDIIDKSDNVLWWFKNGENERKWFAIKYYDDKGISHGFYVDFIVYMKDGSIGLFDTKSGRTAEDSKQKAEALANYIEKENKKGKNLWGGIAVFKDGSLRYNDSKIYRFDEADLGDDWKFLRFD